MAVLRDEVRPIRTGEDVVSVRRRVREWAIESGFSLVDQTKLVTAASELARNALQHGGGGSVRMELLNDGPRRGIRLEFADEGPGIADLDRAMQDGFSTGGGLGLGLGGARRLAEEFHVESTPGQGTRVRIARWR
jgi:serine/threonine-protein kinase RsbT